MAGRSRYTLEELLAQCDPTAPRTLEEQDWLDVRPVGREFGAMRVLTLSRFRRDLNSILRRCETVAIEKHGQVVAKLIPAVTIERMNDAIGEMGASAGAPAHAGGDTNITDDESVENSIAREGRAPDC